jgi:phenylacetate-CoA ligase
MRRMQKITGRSDDMMIVRGVNVFPTQIEELILRQPLLAPHYLCILGKDGPLDTLTVRVEIKAEYLNADAQRRQRAVAALEHLIKNYVGTTARVELREAGSIERSIGKAKRVVDHRRG